MQIRFLAENTRADSACSHNNVLWTATLLLFLEGIHLSRTLKIDIRARREILDSWRVEREDRR